LIDQVQLGLAVRSWPTDLYRRFSNCCSRWRHAAVGRRWQWNGTGWSCQLCSVYRNRTALGGVQTAVSHIVIQIKF